MQKAPRSRLKSTPEFDPGELEDLIYTPAVGSGVSSHLLSRVEVPPSAPHSVTTVVESELTTVAETAEGELATVVMSQDLSSFWRTESGSFVPLQRVRPIHQTADVLAKAELAVVSYLEQCAVGPSSEAATAQAGYDQICRGTRLSRKTVQRTIAKLLDKGFLAIAKPADIYTRTATTYKLCDTAAILGHHKAKGRSHVARVGPGVVYVTPVDKK